MQGRFLGNTGMLVSEIAFGGVEIGLPYGIGVNSERDMISEKEAIHLLQKAIEKGINFFDTARAYGKSELIMGKAFAHCRKEIIISSKCRHFRNENGLLPPNDTIRNLIHQSIKESLESLQTDYLDLYMLHQADLEILDHPVVTAEMQGLRERGTVKAIGVSTYSVEETQKAINQGIWNVIQLPFNLLDQRQQILFKEAKNKGIGIVVRSVLMKGLLSNRGKNLHPALADVETHIQKYQQLLNSGESLPEAAIKFALSFPEVSSVLIGIDKESYLMESVKAANGKYMSKEQLQLAKSLAYPDPAFLNLPHWDKMGWLR